MIYKEALLSSLRSFMTNCIKVNLESIIVYLSLPSKNDF